MEKMRIQKQKIKNHFIAKTNRPLCGNNHFILGREATRSSSIRNPLISLTEHNLYAQNKLSDFKTQSIERC